MPARKSNITPPEKLRRVLSRLWIRELQQFYNNGSICSESHFQCELFFLLKKKLTEKNNYRIWVEANIPQLDSLKTDILISHEQTVIGMIELKYIPHGFPRYENNFQKFEKVRSSKNIFIHLITNPVSGNFDKSVKYYFSPDCLFVFAAIARYNSDAFHDNAWDQLSGNKLMLTGKIDSPDEKLFEVNPEFGRK